MARKEVFNPRRHHLLRKSVPAAENWTSLVLGGLLIAVVLGVWSTRDRIDPASRDLPEELLYAERPPIEIYTPPLKRWVEPGSAPAGAGAPADLGLFPAAITDGGWTVVGRVRTFDASNLYEKINGEAEKFLKQGFETMHYAVLRAPGANGDELAIELYDQGAVQGSTGVFAAHRSSEREVDERDGVTFFGTSIGVIGRTGRYFFRAAGTSASEAIQAKAAQLVDALAALGPGAGAAAATRPAELELLTGALAVEESAVAFKAQNVFQFDFAERFWFADLSGSGGEQARAFVHRGESAAASEALRSRLIEEQAFEYETVPGMQADESSGAAVLLRHRFLGTFFALQRDGAYLFGAQRVNEPAEAASILDRLARAIAPLATRTGENR